MAVLLAFDMELNTNFLHRNEGYLIIKYVFIFFHFTSSSAIRNVHYM